MTVPSGDAFDEWAIKRSLQQTRYSYSYREMADAFSAGWAARATYEGEPPNSPEFKAAEQRKALYEVLRYIEGWAKFDSKRWRDGHGYKGDQVLRASDVLHHLWSLLNAAEISVLKPEETQ